MQSSGKGIPAAFAASGTSDVAVIQATDSIQESTGRLLHP